ncbi:unnamed protein product [Cyprideis torosa]|uniref:N-acetyltransferase domain-containing protein n=1 Tax=Cyprideis torosa TaxID=163714 RepID=A0A7R8ZL29_9CRUS|nr:unnamed protein product [Cyprideis torosa]CAG0892415.1 unnamed protein product [Cyprideis torosa]
MRDVRSRFIVGSPVKVLIESFGFTTQFRAETSSTWKRRPIVVAVNYLAGVPILSGSVGETTGSKLQQSIRPWVEESFGRNLPALIIRVRSNNPGSKEPGSKPPRTLKGNILERCAPLQYAKLAVPVETLWTYLLYYRTYSTWEGRQAYMEDFFVAEPWRRKGIGTAMLKLCLKVRGTGYAQSLSEACSQVWLKKLRSVD